MRPERRRAALGIVAALLICASVLFGTGTPLGAGVAEAAPAEFCLPPLVKCAAPASTGPEADVNVTGFAFPDNPVGEPVKGLFQSHNHEFSYAGFGQGPFCGKTFDPAGVTKAMVDCPEHNPAGIPAWFEQLSSGQLPLTPHDTRGWPTFKDWPKPTSQMHNQTYYKGLERLWRSGARVYVNDATTNRGLCMIYTTIRSACDDMSNIRRINQETRGLQAYIDQQYGGPGKGWYRIVESPAQARQVISEGKLAVIMGIEASEPFGCGRTLDAPNCTTADIDKGLDEMHAAGVRSMFLCHKYDNALCGVRYDSGATGAVVNIGNFLTTGQFWQAQTCTGPRHDNTIAISDPAILTTLLANVTSILKPITLPVYPAGPHCNPIGLSNLGEYLLKGLMKRGMIVEVDHMSVKAADQALTVLEAARYPGVISSHSWMDTGYNQRVLALGGMITPILLDPKSTLTAWKETRAAAPSDRPFAYGYGSDLNGLHTGLPRPGSSPMTYPFTSLDGQATLDRQVWGERTWDLNKDGLAQEGMVPDWIDSVRAAAGPDADRFVEDMTNGAEAYLRMWEAAEGTA